MAILNTNPNPKDVVILQRDDTNTYYGETHISGSQLLLHVNSSGYLDADTSSSFYSLYPPPIGNVISASYAMSASFALVAGSGGTTLTTASTYPITSSWADTALTAFTASVFITSYELSSSWASSSLFASSSTAAVSSISSSYANTASYAMNGGGTGTGTTDVLMVQVFS